MNQHRNETGALARWGLRPHLGLGVMVLALGACDTDGLLEVETPDLITPAVVQDTANISAVRGGAAYEFNRAIGGQSSNSAEPGIVAFGGLLSDELWASSTYTTHRNIDARNVDENNSSANTVFWYLQRARNTTELAARLYANTPRANSAEHAQVTNMAGYTYIMFAENYCSGVPFSNQPFTGAAEFGEPQSTEQMLNRAVERFTAAAALSGATAAEVNLARIGRARALQGLGRFAEAAAAVAQVPTDFVHNVEYSSVSSSQTNGTWYWVNSATRLSSASGEGTNGLRFFNRVSGGAPPLNATLDPRVQVDSVGRGLGTQLPQYNPRKYATLGTSIVLASGIEARLIEAEAQLNKGASAAYLPTLNALRQTAGLAPLTDPGTARGRVLQVYNERAFWLYLTGHRLGDLRRLIWHYGFQANEIFPIGATIFGEPYRDHVNLAVPFAELNNPNYNASNGCTDRTR